MANWKLLRNIAITVVILIASIIVVAPPIASIILKNVLENAGADEVRIGDININPILGRVEIFELYLRDEGKTVLSMHHGLLRLGWLKLLKRQVEISELEFDRVYVDLIEKSYIPLGVRGLDFAQEEEEIEKDVRENPWTFGIDQAAVNDMNIDIQTSKISSHIGVSTLKINNIFTWDREHPTGLIAQGTINDGQYDVDIRLKPIADLRSLDGHIRLNQISLEDIHPLIREQVPAFSGMVSVQSELSLNEQAKDQWRLQSDTSLDVRSLNIGLPQLTITGKLISYQGKPGLSLDLSDDDALSIGINETGTGTLETISIDLGKLFLGVDRLTVSTPEQTDASGDQEQPPEARLTLKGKEQSYEFHKHIVAEGFTLKQDALKLHISKTIYQGIPRITIGPMEKHPERLGTTVDERGKIALENLNLAAGKFSLTSGSIDAEGKNHIFIAPEQKPRFDTTTQVAIRDTHMTDGGILKSFDIGKTQIRDVRFTGTRNLAIRSIDLNKLVLNAEMAKHADKDSQAQPASSKPPKTESKQKSDLPIDIKLGSFTISKGSELNYADNNLNPEYKAKVTLNRFNVTNVDTGDKQNMTKVDIDTTINRYAQLSTKGTVRPFKEIPDVDLVNSLKGINLTRVSPYTTKYAGYDIVNGSLNADSTLKIEDNQIDDTIKLKISNLDMKVSNQEKASEIDSMLAVGLPSALGLLKDSNDDIKLNLPINGDLSDPNFDFSDAIRVVVSKALAKGATAYAAYALQPWGAALLVKEVAGKMVTQVQLDPIVYEPMSNQLPESAELYLQKISELMNNRPGTELKICGVGNQADRNAFIDEIFKKKGGEYMSDEEAKKLRASIQVDEKQVLDLAEQRMFAIKDILIQKHGIPQDRIQTCLVKMSDDPKTGAIVRLGI